MVGELLVTILSVFILAVAFGGSVGSHGRFGVQAQRDKREWLSIKRLNNTPREWNPAHLGENRRVLVDCMDVRNGRGVSTRPNDHVAFAISYMYLVGNVRRWLTTFLAEYERPSRTK